MFHPQAHNWKCSDYEKSIVPQLLLSTANTNDSTWVVHNMCNVALNREEVINKSDQFTEREKERKGKKKKEKRGGGGLGLI